MEACRCGATLAAAGRKFLVGAGGLLLLGGPCTTSTFPLTAEAPRLVPALPWVVNRVRLYRVNEAVDSVK